MVGGASQGPISDEGLLMPTPPPPPAAAAAEPYICRLWVQLAASASRASKCFRCDLYFCATKQFKSI